MSKDIKESYQLNKRSLFKFVISPFKFLPQLLTQINTVIICSCKGESAINASSLVNFFQNLGFQDVVLENELCSLNGLENFKTIVGANPKNLILLACSKKKRIFESIANTFDYPKNSLHILALHELSGWVHKDKEKATEKAKILSLSFLTDVFSERSKADESFGERLVIGKAIVPEDVKILYGRLGACFNAEGWCENCIIFCPQKAISKGESNIIFDRRNCNVCGVCENVCPYDVLKVRPKKDIAKIVDSIFTLPEKIETVKEKGLENKIITFYCSNLEPLLNYMGIRKSFYPEEIIPVQISCLSEISVNLILYTLVKGVSGILLVGCKECTYNVQEYLNALYNFINGIVKDSLLQGRLQIFWCSEKDYNYFEKILINASDMFPKNVAFKKEDFQLDFVNKREDFIKLFSILQIGLKIRKTIKSNPLIPFGLININLKECNMCLNCVSTCPTGALKFIEGSLSFLHDKCIGCKVCVSSCPKGLIECYPLIMFDLLNKEVSPKIF